MQSTPMKGAERLSSGACLRLKKEKDSSSSAAQPIVLQVCQIEAKGSRKKLSLSDGTNTITGILSAGVAAQLGDKLRRFSLLEIQKFTTNEIKGSVVMMVLGAKLVMESVEHVCYGTPMDVVQPASKKLKTGNPATPRPMAVVKPEGSSTSPAAVPLLTSATLPKRLHPIGDLNPYINKWTIKARVTTKGEIRRWSNARGEGSLFSVSLLDEQGTEIRATFFREGCEKYFDVLQQDSIYVFSGGRIKVANRAYTSIKHPYEISFGGEAVVARCKEDSSIKKMSFSFVPLSKLPQTDVGRTVDVVGVIHQDLGHQSFTSKKGNELQKRDLVIVDDSQKSIRCTLWGEQATRPDSDFSDAPVIAIKGCKLSDYGGRSLSTYRSSVIALDPAGIAETTHLRDWYDREVVTNKVTITPMSEDVSVGAGKVKDRKLLSSITSEKLGFGEKPDWVNVKATVCIIKHDKKDGGGPWYTACPEQGNNKKVIEQSDGTWLCVATQQTYPNPEYRYILPLAIMDSSGKQWITLFNDQAVQLLGGKSADDLHALKESDQNAYVESFKEFLWQDVEMRLRVKADTYNDEQRVRAVCSRIRKINYAAESRFLLDQIQGMLD